MILPFVWLVFIVYGWKLVNWLWLKPKKLEKLLRQQGLSGNAYKLLVGDSKEIMTMLQEAYSKPIKLSNDIAPRVMPFFHTTVKRYGKRSFSWSGPTPRVNISDPELISEVLLNTNIYKKQKINPILKYVFTGLADLDDEKWAIHRKIMTPVFYTEKLKLMYPTMKFSCEEMITKWEELLSKNGGSHEFDVLPYLHNFTSAVIARTAFGSSYEEGKRIFELQKELAELVGKNFFTGYIPGWRYVPTKENKRMKKISTEARELLSDIIKKREKSIKLGEPNEDNLLSTLLKSNMKEIEEQAKGNKGFVGMSMDDVIDECKLFYFAGQDTTANLLVWTMILLSVHQDWQSKARDEVLQIFGTESLDYDGLSKLKIVTMIFNEVLRLYPPVMSLTKEVPKDTKLGDLTIPAKTLVTMQVLMVHHDPEIWGEDALEFNPERFSEGVMNATKNKNSVAFFPFSRGPRTCIGNNFALMEAKMALSMILQRFSFEHSPLYIHAPFMAITLQPQHGAHLILHREYPTFIRNGNNF